MYSTLRMYSVTVVCHMAYTAAQGHSYSTDCRLQALVLMHRERGCHITKFCPGQADMMSGTSYSKEKPSNVLCPVVVSSRMRGGYD